MKTQTIADVKVREVMSTPAITISENACVAMVATIMKQRGIGAVIVVNTENKPLGIITEKDLVVRVLSKMADSTFASRVLAYDEESKMITAKNVMTAPLVTVKPEESLSEAAKKMSLLRIRRLGVMSRGKLIGVVSSKDILAVTPGLIRILQEEVQILENNFVDLKQTDLAGYCDQCRNWSDFLTEVDGDLLCEECKGDIDS
ncbi:CBS domain-containing protein [Candidatus Bathyarchaeota archaeon]|nr:CBS domain-containing protein [Candidatus Bathyarchaeota archaeon]NIV43453.1 CBS domain-containing protein [Candidatus Bathyarchaeota archaeon]